MSQNGGVLTLSEAESNSQGSVAAIEEFTINAGNGSLIPPNVGSAGNAVLQGWPTPESTPPWVPVSILLNAPQGFVNPGGFGGWASILDVQPGGGAILYYGTASTLGWNNSLNTDPNTGFQYRGYDLGFIYEPWNVSGYSWGFTAFNNPKALTTDNNGYAYITDTGNKWVEQFSTTSGMHRWNGTEPANNGVTFTYPNGTFVSVPFKQPWAITCDTNNNVWVGDPGYSTSVIQEYAPGGTSVLASWPAIPGCAAHGLAVDLTKGYVYVADASNNVVEVYNLTGLLLTEITDPNASVHEYGPFQPTCLAFYNGYVYIGDGNPDNDFVDVFK